MISQTCDLIIKQEVGRHSRMYGRRGGELSDLVQEACVSVLKCREHSSQPEYIRTAIRNRLQRYAVRIRCREVRLAVDVVARENVAFQPDQFLKELNDDARFVINLILDPDPNFWRPPISFSAREAWLKLLVNKLREFDWSVDRITNAFSIIRSAL